MITPLFLVLPYDRSIKRQAYKNIVEESKFMKHFGGWYALHQGFIVLVRYHCRGIVSYFEIVNTTPVVIRVPPHRSGGLPLLGSVTHHRPVLLQACVLSIV